MEEDSGYRKGGRTIIGLTTYKMSDGDSKCL